MINLNNLFLIGNLSEVIIYIIIFIGFNIFFLTYFYYFNTYLRSNADNKPKINKLEKDPDKNITNNLLNIYIKEFTVLNEDLVIFNPYLNLEQVNNIEKLNGGLPGSKQDNHLSYQSSSQDLFGEYQSYQQNKLLLENNDDIISDQALSEIKLIENEDRDLNMDLLSPINFADFAECGQHSTKLVLESGILAFRDPGSPSI